MNCGKKTTQQTTIKKRPLNNDRSTKRQFNKSQFNKRQLQKDKTTNDNSTTRDNSTNDNSTIFKSYQITIQQEWRQFHKNGDISTTS